MAFEVQPPGFDPLTGKPSATSAADFAAKVKEHKERSGWTQYAGEPAYSDARPASRSPAVRPMPPATPTPPANDNGQRLPPPEPSGLDALKGLGKIGIGTAIADYLGNLPQPLKKYPSAEHFGANLHLRVYPEGQTGANGATAEFTRTTSSGKEEVLPVHVERIATGKRYDQMTHDLVAFDRTELARAYDLSSLPQEARERLGFFGNPQSGGVSEDDKDTKRTQPQLPRVTALPDDLQHEAIPPDGHDQNGQPYWNLTTLDAARRQRQTGDTAPMSEGQRQASKFPGLVQALEKGPYAEKGYYFRASPGEALPTIVSPPGSNIRLEAFQKADGTWDIRPNAVWHATTSAGRARSIARGIKSEFLASDSRFGRAFYIAEEPGTTLAELAHYGINPETGLRFSLNRRSMKVLDLTDPKVAAEWAYKGGPITAETQSIGAKAQADGYNVIRFHSQRLPGAVNMAVIKDFNEILKLDMIIPVTP